LITLEKDGPINVVTIMDDTGHDEELIFTWEEGGDLFYMRQKNYEGDDPVIGLTKLQTSILKDILNQIIVEH
jgi:hypothetical protein